MRNTKSILFLFEGYTEKEFYAKIFEKYLPHRKIKITKSNLKGNTNINKRIKGRINGFLDHKSYFNEKSIYVVVAFDREGKRQEKESMLDIEGLENEFVNKNKSRIKGIYELIATQDLESWFFHDIDGIFNFLRVPEKERNTKKYNNIEELNNKSLAGLFRRYGRVYIKRGNPVEGFINSLDIERIYESCNDLRSGIVFIRNLCH